MNLARWLSLMETLHLPPSRSTFDELKEAYSTCDRHYHNDQHIARCLAELDVAALHIPDLDPPDPGPIELALWFHDAVYDSHAENNELESAVWAAQFLTSAGAAPILIDRVVRLVLATRHLPNAETEDEEWIRDIDLASLGREPADFWQDNRAIRREYEWVPMRLYRERRITILRAFLERPFIYATAYFRERYEVQARQNLTKAIQQLEEDAD